MKKNCLILFLILNSMVAYSQYRTEKDYLGFEGYERSYEIYVPEKYSEKIKYPVVFVLHGGGGTAKGLIRSTRARFNYLANRDNFIAVYPNGIKKSWNDGARDTIGIARKLKINDVGFIDKIIENLILKYSIDNESIFACGISNGGFMSQKLAFELSDKIKGIGVVAANLSEVQSKNSFPQKPVPVIFINGTKDPLIPYNGGYVTVLNKKRGKVLSVDKSID
ncbi:MAG: phospholipase, partial [Draconibacterium sp.]|nr:phospholipase [Draconibacterium sp.]